MVAIKKDADGNLFLIANGEVMFPLPDKSVYDLNIAVLNFSERGADEMDDDDRARWRGGAPS